MFLELHLRENDNKIMLNIDRIQSIYQERRGVSIYIGEIVYEVKESYEDIVEAINNWSKLAKA